MSVRETCIRWSGCPQPIEEILERLVSFGVLRRIEFAGRLLREKGSDLGWVGVCSVASARLGLGLERWAGRCVFSESFGDMSLGRSPSGQMPEGPPGKGREARGVVRAWQVLRGAGRRMLRLPGRVLVGAFQDGVTTMFPGDCRLCGGPLLSVREVLVCAGCAERAGRRQEGLLCAVCGEGLGLEGERAWRQFGVAGEAARCTMCRRARPGFARAVAWGLYDDELREMSQGFKYEQGMERVGGLLGRLLAGAMLLVEPEAAREVMVVAVPLARGRRRERGFNQVDRLLDAALPEVRRRSPEWRIERGRDVLERERETESQWGLTPRQRRANVRGAFAVRDAAAVRGREVMVVDDIYTTGATARECARVLLEAGAAKVWVATVSRAQEEQAGVWEGAREERGVAMWGTGDG